MIGTTIPTIKPVIFFPAPVIGGIPKMVGVKYEQRSTIKFQLQKYKQFIEDQSIYFNYISPEVAWTIAISGPQMNFKIVL